MKTKVVTDSGGGLSKEQAESLGIAFLPLQVMADGKDYLDGVDLDANKLEDMLKAGVFPTTSQPRLSDVEEMMEEFEKDGVTDIIQVTLSSGLSSTTEQIQAAAKRHGLTIHTVDPWSTLYIERYLALAAQKMVDEGKSPQEIQQALQKVADEHNGYLIVEDLDHLVAGGRLTPMAAKLGSMLKIKPIMKVGKGSGGKVDVFEKVRTFSKSMKKVVDQVEKEIDPNKKYLFYIGSKDNRADEMEALIHERFGDNIEIVKDPIYPVIACHTGMGCAGIQYMEKLDGVELV